MMGSSKQKPKEEMPQFKGMIFGFVILLVTMWFVYDGFKEEAAEAEIEEQMRQQEFSNYSYCSNNMVVDEKIEYDLIKDYNMTCESIKFNIDNWVKEFSYQREYAGSGFLSTRYETIKKYYGVGHIQLLREEITWKPIEECEGHGRSSSSSIYLEENFVNYYADKCLNDGFTEVDE